MVVEPDSEPLPGPLDSARETRVWSWLSTGFWLSMAAGFVFLFVTTAHTTLFQLGAVLTTTAVIVGRERLPEDAVPDPVFGVCKGLGLGFLAGTVAVDFGRPAVAALLGGVACYTVLDGIQRLRHGSPATETDDAVESTDDRRPVPADLADSIERRLDGTALTRREIRERVDADPEQVDAALARLRDAGRIERAGSAYRTTAAESPARLDGLRDWLAGVRDRVAPRVSRLAWPVAVEFGADAGDEHPVDRSTGSSDASGRVGPAASGTDGERDRDRESEPEPAGG